MLLVLVLVAWAISAYAATCTFYRTSTYDNNGNLQTGEWRTDKQGALVNAVEKAINAAPGHWSDCTFTSTYQIVNTDTGAVDWIDPGCTNSIGVFGGKNTQRRTLGYATKQDACPVESWCKRVFAGKDLGDVTWVGGLASEPDADLTAAAQRYWCEPAADADDGTKGCTATVDPDMAYLDASIGRWVAVGRGTGLELPCDPALATGDGSGPNQLAPGTGSASSGSGKGDAAAGQVGASACPSGKVPGEVNGTQVCVNPGPDTPVTSKVEESATKSTPDGTSTTSTSTVTRCKDGKCTSSSTSTVTTSTASGTSTSVVSGGGTTSRGSYCKDKPGDPQCGESSGFGGSCEAGFECSGDAVQCAAAKGIWDQKCALIDGPKGGADPAELAAYKAATAASGAASGAGLGTTDVTISSQDFDQSNALGVAAQCVTDQQVTVWNTPVTIQFSKVCPYVEWLGSVMLGIAWLVAAVVVGKGVKG